jgi:hypothetical protein
VYLAHFEAGGREWVQAAARIETGRVPGGGASKWKWVARQLCAIARLPESTVGRRIRLDSERLLHQVVALTAPAEYELRLRETVGRLTRTERFTGTSVWLPQLRAERDSWLDVPGQSRFCTAGDSYSVRGVPVACDFRVAPLLNDLLVDACLAGYALTYQVHIRSAQVDSEEARAARRSVLALRDIPGVRDSMMNWQEEMARRLPHARAICEEYLATDSAEAAAWLESWLADRFNATYGRFGFAAAARLREGAYEDALTGAVHSYDLGPWSPAELSGGALSWDERDRLLEWCPSAALEDLLEPGDASSDPAEPPPAGSGPITYNGEDSFAFASYKRQDLPLAAPVMRKVRECGVPVWYDAHIPGGAEWDEVIEDRLARSRFVIAFLSAAAVESKYVRREVKFADALNRPLLTVVMEDVTLRYGLKMMMTQYQMLDMRARDFGVRLEQAVRRMFEHRQPSRH